MLGRGLVGCLAAGCLAFAAAGTELRIVAGSAPGSGWDQLAQALAGTLAADDPDMRPDVVNAPGNNGVVGLQRFLADGLDDAILVTGLTMMDATFVYRAPVGLDRLTPLARLCAESFLLAVAPSSPLNSVEDVRAALAAAEPGRFTWGGGPAAGVDHLAAILLSGALGFEPARITYVSFLATHDGAVAAAEGRVSAVFLPAGEVAADVKAGKLRVIASSSPGLVDGTRPDGSDIPTLFAAGVTLDLTNWRGLLARPDLPDDRRRDLAVRLARVPENAAWREFLDKKGWRDAYLPAERFGAFLQAEQTRVRNALSLSGALKRE